MVDKVSGSTLSWWQRFERTTVGEYLKVIVLAAIIVFGFIRPCVVEGYRIPSESMEETLLVGDRILVCKFIYGVNVPGLNAKFLDYHKPARGDVFVFQPPHDPRPYIKRIVAVAGDMVETTGNTLYVNGKAIDDSNYAKHLPARPSASVAPTQWRFPRLRSMPDFPPFREPEHIPDGEAFDEYKLPSKDFKQQFREGKPFVVPEGYVFAMGDNRDMSRDSRSWGPVPVESIKGQAFMIYWSYDETDRAMPWQLGRILGNIRLDRIGRLIRSQFDGNEG